MTVLRRLVVAAVAIGAPLLLVPPAWAVPNQQDTAWMVAAHQSNLAEIAAGTTAQERATTETVRDLGAMFVAMHTELDADLVAAAQQLGVTLPTAPTAAQQQELAAVAANPGAAFDSAWVAQQLGSHQASKANGQVELAQGSDPVVLELARAAAPVIDSHLASLQAAAAQYGAPTRVEAGSGGQAARDDRWSTATIAMMLGGLALVGGAVLLTARLRRPS